MSSSSSTDGPQKDQTGLDVYEAHVIERKRLRHTELQAPWRRASQMIYTNTNRTRQSTALSSSFFKSCVTLSDAVLLTIDDVNATSSQLFMNSTHFAPVALSTIRSQFSIRSRRSRKTSWIPNGTRRRSPFHPSRSPRLSPGCSSIRKPLRRTFTGSGSRSTLSTRFPSSRCMRVNKSDSPIGFPS